MTMTAIYILQAPVVSGVDWFSQFTNNLTDLTTNNGGALTSFGLTLLSFIAFFQLVKMVVNFSLPNMSFSLNPSPLEGGEIVRFMLRLLFCCLMETYWTQALPGSAYGLNKFFAVIAQQIVTTLDHAHAAELNTALAQAWGNTPSPNPLSLLEVFAYMFVQGIMAIASAIMFVINVSGVVFYAVAALFGPIFIPLYMTESYRPKFFQFFDVLLSFAMIRAVAAAFIFVWSGFITTFMQQTFNGDYSIALWIANLVPVSMVMLAFTVNMLFIPQITQAIFGGAAGATSSAQQLITRAVMSAAKGGA